LLLIVALAGFAAPAAAQYMYLDSNGNGVHDGGDRLAANGTATTVDVWINTNHNRDGSLATCDSDGTLPLGLNSYVVNLLAANGLVSYSGFVNRISQFNVAFGELNPGDGLRYKNGFGGPTSLPPGTYRLATVTITGISGTPNVGIVDMVSGSVDFTSFGTGAGGCFGNDFDNTYKLSGPAGGTDWFDADGLTPASTTDTPPVVNNPGNKTVNEGQCLNFPITAFAPDGHPVTFALALTPPPGASITAGGQFTWCPTEAQGPGIYSVTVVVADNVTSLTNSTTFQVTVLEVNTAPILNPISDKTVTAGNNLIFTATATDADAPPNQLTFSLDPGAPTGANISAGGVFGWNPSVSQAPGVYTISVRVTDNGVPALSDAKSFMVTVQTGGEGTPVLQAPANMTVAEGDVADQTLHGFDPDNTPLTFSKFSGPLFMTVTTTSPTTGNVHLEPGFADAGSYSAIVRASDGVVFDQKSFSITVLNVCQAPIANAGGPYSGFVGVPVMFNGGGSSDPDGGALSYAWNFGDGNAGTGPTPSHPYAAGGSYLVTLRVTNPCGRFADAAVTANIAATCVSALAFTEGGNNKTSLGAGKPQTCFQVQPVNGSFNLSNVDLSSVVMISQGTGAVSQIHAVANKTSVGGDKNNDGVDELSACFTKTDLQQIFSNIQGTQVVNVTLQGNLFTGGSFCTTIDHTVKSGGGGNHVASIRPNPLNPSAVLTFSTTRAGAAKVQLFDMQGRLIKTLLDQSTTAAGYHDVQIDGRDATGNRLASGVYYVKIQSVEGTEAKAITILK